MKLQGKQRYVLERRLFFLAARHAVRIVWLCQLVICQQLVRAPLKLDGVVLVQVLDFLYNVLDAAVCQPRREQTHRRWVDAVL